MYKKLLLMCCCLICLLTGCSSTSVNDTSSQETTETYPPGTIVGEDKPQGTLGDDLKYYCFSNDEHGWDGYGYIIEEKTEPIYQRTPNGEFLPIQNDMDYKYQITISDSYSRYNNYIIVKKLLYNKDTDTLSIFTHTYDFSNYDSDKYGMNAPLVAGYNIAYNCCGVYLNRLPSHIEVIDNHGTKRLEQQPSDRTHKEYRIGT